jgi:hypothetical protein
MMIKLLLRDISIVILTLLLWRFNSHIQSRHDSVAVAIAVLTGFATVVAGFLAHEWGHLLGALSRGGAVELPQRLASVFLFQFDIEKNSREQFLAMSFGGFAASIVVVALLLVVLDFNGLADRVALILTALGVLATFVVEIPGAVRVYRNKPAPLTA